MILLVHFTLSHRSIKDSSSLSLSQLSFVLFIVQSVKRQWNHVEEIPCIVGGKEIFSGNTYEEVAVSMMITQRSIEVKILLKGPCKHNIQRKMDTCIDNAIGNYGDDTCRF